jgi:hypothetical protein
VKAALCPSCTPKRGSSIKQSAVALATPSAKTRKEQLAEVTSHFVQWDRRASNSIEAVVVNTKSGDNVVEEVAANFYVHEGLSRHKVLRQSRQLRVAKACALAAVLRIFNEVAPQHQEVGHYRSFFQPLHQCPGSGIKARVVAVEN